MKSISEKLFFNYEVTHQDGEIVNFQINFETIINILNFFIREEKLTDFPNNFISEMKEKYDFENKNLNLFIEEVDTFDYEFERKYHTRNEIQENEYEKYTKQSN